MPSESMTHRINTYKTIKIKKINKLYKTIIESKLTKTSTLSRIYQYLHTIKKRIDKNKTNVKTDHKHNTKIILNKTT